MRAHYPDLGAHPAAQPLAALRRRRGRSRRRSSKRGLPGWPPTEALRARFDLVVTSVLLDAGAGPAWRSASPARALAFGRSEGLAVASFHMFMAGGFSSAPEAARCAPTPPAWRRSTRRRWRGLSRSRPTIPWSGSAGRAALLRRLGAVVQQAATPRRHRAGIGEVAGRRLIANRCVRDRGAAVPAASSRRCSALLGPIWPGRQSLPASTSATSGRHPQLGLVPFHKLSQWLTYSLLEPLEAARASRSPTSTSSRAWPSTATAGCSSTAACWCRGRRRCWPRSTTSVRRWWSSGAR